MMRETQPSTKYAELVSLTETGDRAWIEHLDLPFLDPTYLWISKLTPFLKNPLEDKLNPIKKSKKSCCLNELAWARLHGAHTCGELENFYPCQSGGCLNKYGIITTQPKSSHKRFIHVNGLILHLQSSPKMLFSDSTPKVCGYTDIKQTLHNNSFVEEVRLYEDLLSVYWTTCNPCSLSHNPSGSAGGEAALQACAGLPISFASDTGGSIRTLAAFSGVFGDKPTPNIVSNHGADMQEQNYPVMESMQALGPMGCHVQDISSILQVLCGDNAHLPPLDADVFLTKCRFFYLMSHVDDGAVSPVEPMVWHATQRVVDYLEYNFGVIVKPLHIPELVDILSLHTEEKSRLSPNNFLCSDIVNRDGNMWMGLEILCSVTGLGRCTAPVLAQASMERAGLMGSFVWSIFGFGRLLNNQKLSVLEKGINNGPVPPTKPSSVKNQRSFFDSKTLHRYIWMIWIVILNFLVNVMSYDYSFLASEEPPQIKCGYPTKVHSCLSSFSVYFLTIHAHLKKKNYGNLQRLRDIFLSMLNSILKNQKTLRGMWISKLLSIFQQVQKTNQLGNSIEEHSWSSVSCQL